MSSRNVSGGGRGSAGGTNPGSSVPKKLSPAAERSIAEARKALKSVKPTPAELAKRARAEKANEIAKIRKQGRNTR